MNSEFKNYSNLEKAILKVLAFFDIFDYPLTSIEIYKWLYQPEQIYKLSEIIEQLDYLNSKNIINFKNGFYFFPGRNDLINTRLNRYQYAEKKFKLALKAAKALRWMAFIKMIAVCNNAGYSNANKNSDIDFFIVVKKGRLFWSRFMITIAVQLLGLRRHKQKITNKICLSFYITDDHINLKDIALTPVDPYLIYWFATLSPIYDRESYTGFMAANSWLDDYLPNFYQTFLSDRRQVKDNKLVKFSYSLDEKVIKGNLGRFLERFIKKLQLGKMKMNTNSLAKEPDSRVIINDTMLKFHERDRRDFYRTKWQKKLNSIGL